MFLFILFSANIFLDIGDANQMLNQFLFFFLFLGKQIQNHLVISKWPLYPITLEIPRRRILILCSLYFSQFGSFRQIQCKMNKKEINLCRLFFTFGQLHHTKYKCPKIYLCIYVVNLFSITPLIKLKFNSQSRLQYMIDIAHQKQIIIYWQAI